MTGPSVQTTSIAVLWLVLDGTGFAPSRNFTTTTMSRARTNRVIGTMNHSVYCSNQRISSMIEVAAGWRPFCQSNG